MYKNLKLQRTIQMCHRPREETRFHLVQKTIELGVKYALLEISFFHLGLFAYNHRKRQQNNKFINLT